MLLAERITQLHKRISLIKAWTDEARAAALEARQAKAADYAERMKTTDPHIVSGKILRDYDEPKFKAIHAELSQDKDMKVEHLKQIVSHYGDSIPQGKTRERLLHEIHGHFVQRARFANKLR